MAKPQQRTRSSAVRQVAPPPLSQHLREVVSRPGAWAVIGRNLIPVVGIYAFGWSAALSVFNYWFDGLTAVIAIVTAVIPRAIRETRSKSDGIIKTVAGCLVAWIVLVVVVALPVLDRPNSAARSLAWLRTVASACPISSALVHIQLTGSESFLESVPRGL